MWRALRKALEDSTGAVNLAECAVLGGTLTYLGLTIANYVQHAIVPTGTEFGVAIGGIVAAYGAAQQMRGDRQIDAAKAGARNAANPGP